MQHIYLNDITRFWCSSVDDESKRSTKIFFACPTNFNVVAISRYVGLPIAVGEISAEVQILKKASESMDLVIGIISRGPKALGEN